MSDSVYYVLPPSAAQLEALEAHRAAEDAAADAAYQRYANGLICEARAIVDGYSDVQPSIEHLRMLFELLDMLHPAAYIVDDVPF